MSTLTVVPTVDIGLQHRPLIVEPLQTASYRFYTPNSVSNNAINWSVIPPSIQCFMDRSVFAQVTFHVEINGTGAAHMFIPGSDAPRFMPLNSVINSTTIGINNWSNTFLNSQMIHPLSRYIDEGSLANLANTFPSYCDKFGQYADGITTMNNSLGTYANAVQYHQPRGAFPMTVISNTSTQAIIEFTTIEPVICPPLLPIAGCYQRYLGLNEMTQFTVYMAMMPDLSRVWSHALASENINAINVTIASARLLVNFETPTEQFVPRNLKYASAVYNRYITSINAPLTTGSEISTNTNSIQLMTIPRRMLIYVQDADAYRNYTTPDTYARITSLKIQFNNREGLLSEASEAQLYAMCHVNGMNVSWPEWVGGYILGNTDYTPGAGKGGVGSVIAIDFARNLPLGEHDWVGKNGAYNLTLNITARNNSGVTYNNVTITVITINDGTLTIGADGVVSHSMGITEQEMSQPHHYVPFQKLGRTLYGGGFGEWVNWGVGKLKNFHDYLKENQIISKVASTIPHPIAQTVGTIAKEYGYGYNGGMSMGGATTSREELLAKLKRI